MPMQQLTLAGIKEGAVEERFQIELMRVLNNIRDPNTDAKATREITVKVIFKPGDQRDQAFVVVKATSKLAGIHGVGTFVEIRNAGEDLVALEPFVVDEDRQQVIPELRGLPAPNAPVSAFPGNNRPAMSEEVR